MTPGTFSEYTGSTGYSSGDLFRPSSSGSMMEYTDKGHEVPTLGKVIYLGEIHNGGLDHRGGVVELQLSTDTWTRTNSTDNGNYPFGGTGGSAFSHGFHDSTIDTVRGHIWRRPYGGDSLWRGVWSSGLGEWEWEERISFASLETGEFKQVAGGLEYFPDRDSLIGYVFGYGLFEVPITTEIPAALSAEIGAFSTYQVQMRYDANEHCIVLCGGTAGRKITTTASIVAIGMAGASLSLPNGANGSILCRDPVTGRVLAWTDADAYEFDGDDFVDIGMPNVPGDLRHSLGIFDIMAAPVSEAAGILFASAGTTASGKIFAYRHG
jgi:hypothetical protein